MVTHGGGKELEEPLIVRPTSETVIDSFFAQWIQSHRDLPLLVNQWANVVRWELRPRLFLRPPSSSGRRGIRRTPPRRRPGVLTAHTASVYASTMADVACLPVLTGHKTARERFAGAIRTWTCEGMMGDGKALQMGTSHELGQNFARAFGIAFSNTEGTTDYVWQTSWGVSTRLIGGLVMGHGDDFGLRVPPALAPAQVVVVVVKEEKRGGAGHGGVGGGRARGRPVTASVWTVAPRPARSAQRGTGSSRAYPSGWRSGRGTSPEGTVTVGHPAPADQGEGGAGGSGPRPSRPSWARVGSELMDEATAARHAHHGGRHVGGRGH